ncbi:MAG TPA: hypothetical protein VF752_07095 [Thermoleophilaceae bacterium]
MPAPLTAHGLRRAKKLEPVAATAREREDLAEQPYGLEDLGAFPVAAEEPGTYPHEIEGERRAGRKGRIRLVLATIAFPVVLAALFSKTWQLMPFPDTEAALAALGTGFAFGLAVHRWSAMWLTLAVLPAGMGGEGGFFGGVVALFVVGPFALVGLTAGVALVKRLARVAIRRMIAPARTPLSA